MQVTDASEVSADQSLEFMGRPCQRQDALGGSLRWLGFHASAGESEGISGPLGGAPSLFRCVPYVAFGQLLQRTDVNLVGALKNRCHWTGSYHSFLHFRLGIR